MDVADQGPDGQIRALAQNELGSSPATSAPRGVHRASVHPGVSRSRLRGDSYSWHLELSFH
jgi:hypothetical protein